MPASSHLGIVKRQTALNPKPATLPLKATCIDESFTMIALEPSVRRGGACSLRFLLQPKRWLTVQTEEVGGLKQLQTDLGRDVHVWDIRLVHVLVPVQKVLNDLVQDIGTARCEKVQWLA